MQKQLYAEGCLGRTRSGLLDFRCHPPTQTRQHCLGGLSESCLSTWPQGQMVYSSGTEQSSTLLRVPCSCIAMSASSSIFTHVTGTLACELSRCKALHVSLPERMQMQPVRHTTVANLRCSMAGSSLLSMQLHSTQTPPTPASEPR